MTFADLFTALDTRGVLTRAKDKKTSLRYLVAALGQSTLEQCPVDAACREEATWAAALETHFATLTAQGRTISAATRRNTRNDLRVLFRLAEAHGLLTAPLPERLLAKPLRKAYLHQQKATAPYQTTYKHQARRRYWLPQAAWPSDIQAGWRTYQAKCGLRLRETTLRSYAIGLMCYLGYLVHVVGRTPTWDDCFDVARLTEFVRWHAARVGRPMSVQGRHVVIQNAAMAKVLGHRNARALADLRNTLKAPVPLHNKRQHWVSLAQLEAVAEACLAEGRVPLVFQAPNRHPGAQRACRFQRGVMLKLLVRIPLRQRNLREMRLDQHLYQDQADHWHLHFSGADLKIGHRGSQVNEYHVDLTEYCPDFIPVLVEFLTAHRPHLPKATDSKLLFLTQGGKPYTSNAMHAEISLAVSMRTGQRFYPHLIRTIWATEFLEKTQDYATAATMLGDTLAMVMKTYYDFIHKDHHTKAKAFLGSALHTG
jgi:hypothetical protein